MQFLIIGRDDTDNEAKARRQAAREKHIKMGEELLASGNLWYGAAILNEQGEMAGSIYMVDFESREALDKYLEEEPYVVGEVWKEIEIIRCNTRDPWQFNRPKEFFKSR